MLAPRSRDLRIERALRWQAQNAKDRHGALNGLDLTGQLDEDKVLEKRLNALDRIADARGPTHDFRGGYKSTSALRAAEAAFPNEPLGFLLPWQICSGFAHGRPWAFLGVAEREHRDSDVAGIVNVRLTSDLARTLYPTLAALRLVERYLRLFKLRSTAGW